MARTLRSSDNGVGHNSIPAGENPESPYAKRIIALERDKQAIVADIKQVYIEAKEADCRVQPIRLAVKRYFETEEQRQARESKEAEAERILRALGPDYAKTPLGDAAISAARE